MVVSIRRCLACSNPIGGRRDKKFCDDDCRNTYNNKLKSEHVNSASKVNGILYKNRTILKKLLGEETTVKASKEYMLRKGFKFDYLTNIVVNKKGNLFHFVFEYGHFKVDDETYLIVKN